MHTLHPWQSIVSSYRSRAARDAPASRRLTAGGTAGNERLTAADGARPARAARGDRRDDPPDQAAAVGAPVRGDAADRPVALKLGSTGYRFVRYYTANPSYRRKGPPPRRCALIAPIVVLSTVVVFASGVALLFAGPASRGTLLPIHKVSFFVWVAFTALHVLAHLPKIAARAARRLRTLRALERRRRRAQRAHAVARRRADRRGRARGPRHSRSSAPGFNARLSTTTDDSTCDSTRAHHTRDAALRKLTRANRWLIAGSVALTGLLTEVAAQRVPRKDASRPRRAPARQGEHKPSRAAHPRAPRAR